MPKGGIGGALHENAIGRAEVTNEPPAIRLAVDLAVLTRNMLGLRDRRQIDIDRPRLRIEPADDEPLAEQRDLLAREGAVAFAHQAWLARGRRW